MDERTNCTEFYVRGSVRRNSRLKKFNEMQQYADIYLLLNLFAVRLRKFNEMQQYAEIYLLLNYSTRFGRPPRQSSGVHKTVVAASGTDVTVGHV